MADAADVAASAVNMPMRTVRVIARDGSADWAPT
jgi:hypothetical protein